MRVVVPILRLLALAATLMTASAGSAVAESTPASDHAGGGEGGEAAAGSQFVELDGLNVTLYRNNAPAGVLTARLVLQLHSDEARGTVIAAKAKLRDALLRELYRLTEREANNGPKVDLDIVKAGMLKAARRALGPDVVDDVLVQALLRRGA